MKLTILAILVTAAGAALAQEPEKKGAARAEPGIPALPRMAAEPLVWAFQEESAASGSFFRRRSGPQTYLGVAASMPGPDLAAHLPLPQDTGLVVETVEADSPAAKAGILQNDVLARLDDQILISPQQLYVLVANKKEGDTVRITLVRKGESREVSAVLGRKEMATDAFPHAGPMAEGVDILLESVPAQPLRTFTRRFGPTGGMDHAGLSETLRQHAMEEAEKVMKNLPPGARVLKVQGQKRDAASSGAAVFDEDTIATDELESVRQEISDLRSMVETLVRSLQKEDRVEK